MNELTEMTVNQIEHFKSPIDTCNPSDGVQHAYMNIRRESTHWDYCDIDPMIECEACFYLEKINLRAEVIQDELALSNVKRKHEFLIHWDNFFEQWLFPRNVPAHRVYLVNRIVNAIDDFHAYNIHDKNCCQRLVWWVR